MATILFSALGTVLGGPLGGAIGALVGRQIDGAIIGGRSSEGPHLKDLSVTTSTYGSRIARHYGRMRVPGSVIWATDLVEHRQTQGGGKGKPSVTTYSYSASFAVALASRPINGIGRIWADGNLLRGAAGDLRAAGTLRVYTGTGNQTPDPLLAAAEGPDSCPAYRGMAYVVFQDLQVGDFGNRIPTLTFEVFADAGELNLGAVLGEEFDDASVDVDLAGVAGLSWEGPAMDLIEQISLVAPTDCDVSGPGLAIRSATGGPAALLRAPTVTAADDGFGAQTGIQRKRAPLVESPPETVRYYDVERDYQPGLQRVLGRPSPGQPSGIELPVATTSADARRIIESASRRAGWARQTISWRTAEIDPAIKPGALVTVPDQSGVWTVADWEWRASGIELTLWRSPPEDAAMLTAPSDPGRVLAPSDVPLGPTVLAAFEAPWDGTGSGDLPLIFAAASSNSSKWAGAALYLDMGDGQLQWLGSTGRTRNVMGHVTNILGPASPHLFDRRNVILVDLLAADMQLQDATTQQLASGANRALIGSELIQFTRAVPLGLTTWRLEGLLRGRGGTEPAIALHVASETFLLLNGTAVAVDGAIIGQNSVAHLAAAGAVDAVPVSAAIACRGITQKPLFPVRPGARLLADGSMELSWTRRARGAWAWLDSVETPLHEEQESYDVIVGSPDAPTVLWTVAQPSLTIAPVDWANLRANHPGANLSVRQRGSYSVSDAMLITTLT